VGKGSRNRQQARAKVAEMRAQEARRRRRQRVLTGAGAVVAAAGVAAGVTLAVTSSHGGGGSSPQLKLASLSTLGPLRPAPAPGATGPEGVPVPPAAPLSSAPPAATGQNVDGISCQTNEKTDFHIHAHLTIFVNGVPRQVAASIGIPGGRSQNQGSGPFIVSGTCFYWLHTHAADGIIHIESPIQRTYTLGDFFDEWGQPLGPNQVGPAQGHVTALYNSQVYKGNPRNIPLNAHAQIQLEVGKPLFFPISISFPNGL
jgi:hypothetical protein